MQKELFINKNGLSAGSAMSSTSFRAKKKSVRMPFSSALSALIISMGVFTGPAFALSSATALKTASNNSAISNQASSQALKAIQSRFPNIRMAHAYQVQPETIKNLFLLDVGARRAYTDQVGSFLMINNTVIDSVSRKPIDPTLQKTVDTKSAAILGFLNKNFPAIKASSVAAVSPDSIKNLYVFKSGQRYGYIDGDMTYIYSDNDLLDISTKRRISDDNQRIINSNLVNEIDKTKAIVLKYGNGQRTMISLEDPDCPGCQFLSNSIMKDTETPLNMTHYVYLYPLTDLHPDAKRKADLIWCAGPTNEDRAKAWKNWMLNKKLPETVIKGCVSPVKANISKFSDLGVFATPTLIFKEGSVVQSGLNSKQIGQILDITK